MTLDVLPYARWHEERGPTVCCRCHWRGEHISPDVAAMHWFPTPWELPAPWPWLSAAKRP